ncbi:MAG: hypothetical protein ACRD8Z_01310, partial [Nitrososphaeraceae archaeon]
MKQTNSQKYMIEKACLITCVVAAAFILLASIAVTSYLLGPVSAQITPSVSTPDSSTISQSSVLPKNLQSADLEGGFTAQNTAGSVQNNATTNITQLATIAPIVEQPITPASLAPVSAESSGDSNDDDSGDDSNDDDSGDDSN